MGRFREASQVMVRIRRIILPHTLEALQEQRVWPHIVCSRAGSVPTMCLANWAVDNTTLKVLVTIVRTTGRVRNYKFCQSLRFDSRLRGLSRYMKFCLRRTVRTAQEAKMYPGSNSGTPA